MDDADKEFRMRVLVVDDEPEIRLVVRYALEDADVTDVATGPDALDVLRDGSRFDAVVLDIMMPGMSGIDVLTAIRRDQTLRRLPVVMLTAKAGETDHLVSFRHGADAYLTKPFAIEDIQRVLAEVVDLSAEQRIERRKAEIRQAELLMRIESSFHD